MPSYIREYLLSKRTVKITKKSQTRKQRIGGIFLFLLLENPGIKNDEVRWHRTLLANDLIFRQKQKRSARPDIQSET